MAKVKTLEECVLELDGVRKCAFCGTELAEGEVCTCNKYKLVLRNLHYIEVAEGQVEHYQGIIQSQYDNMPEPSYEIREAIVQVSSTSEPPVEEDDNNGGVEPIDGGGE